ncbi:MAG: hypothetical protein PHR81_08330 [Bacteroidales bacterium]|jgi:hypothetical protein|nr:hypothetical protein [Bacteroidales bacterium]MDD4214801.1 hypothetical protein [Bacteroidales bacterium]
MNLKQRILTSFIFMFSIQSILFAQEAKKTPVGLGIDLGLGYNTMNETIEKDDGSDSTVKYNCLFIQPCFRLHYDIRVKDFGKSNSLKIKTFLGYYAFGGKIKYGGAGLIDVITLSSIEAGAGLSLDFIEMFQLSPLFKAQYVVLSTKRFVRENPEPPRDIKADIKPFSYNAGFQFRFKYKHFTIAAEAWLGLVDISKKANESIKENNYRLILGYEF